MLTNATVKSNMDEQRKSYDQLVAENATCFEFAWNGFVRLYKEGENPCECKSCVAIEELKAKGIRGFFT